MFFRMFGRIAATFQRFMIGRRGLDTLGIVLICVDMACLFLSNFFVYNRAVYFVINAIGLCSLLLFVLRFFSRNYAKRERENAVARRVLNRVKKWFRNLSNRIRDRKTHRYFKCPACKNTLRVPKGKGSITVTCPVCRERVKKRT